MWVIRWQQGQARRAKQILGLLVHDRCDLQRCQNFADLRGRGEQRQVVRRRRIVMLVWFGTPQHLDITSHLDDPFRTTCPPPVVRRPLLDIKYRASISCSQDRPPGIVTGSTHVFCCRPKPRDAEGNSPGRNGWKGSTWRSSCRSTADLRWPTPNGSAVSPNASSRQKSRATTSSWWSRRWATPPTGCWSWPSRCAPRHPPASWTCC